jgi:tRNA(Arg) A34 adenosine deaminase TadA
MKYLDLAIRIAKGGTEERNYRIGCVGIRTDGAIVVAPNLLTKKPEHTAHAEYRTLSKSDAGVTLYVARIHRDDTIALAKPCVKCQALIRNRRVKRVFYTISPEEYGVWDPKYDIE